jgi:hypothetical protein
MYLTSGSFIVSQWGTTYKHLDSLFCWESRSRSEVISFYTTVESGKRKQYRMQDVINSNVLHMTPARLTIIFYEE